MAEQLSTFDENSPEGSAPQNDEARDRDLRTAELTTREIGLLLEYGYPFADEEQKLRASKAVGGIHRVRLGSYWIELMIADLIRSAKEIRNRQLLDELDELCSTLEFSLNDARDTPLR
jgi:hypothetical protein